VSEVILGQFRDLGVRVVTAESGTDVTAADEDATRVPIRQVLGAVSQFEKSVIVAKLRAARLRQRRQTGRCEGRKPFGEQAVLHRIRHLRRKPRGRERLSYGAIGAAGLIVDAQLVVGAAGHRIAEVPLHKRQGPLVPLPRELALGRVHLGSAVDGRRRTACCLQPPRAVAPIQLRHDDRRRFSRRSETA
jgi:hypothetical protein